MYEENVAIIDSYQKDIISGSSIHSAELSLRSKFSFSIQSDDSNQTATLAYGIIFKKPAMSTSIYSKKRLVSEAVWAYVSWSLTRSSDPSWDGPVSYVFYLSDNVASGKTLHGKVGERYNYYIVVASSPSNFEVMPNGQYVRLSPPTKTLPSSIGDKNEIEVGIMCDNIGGYYANKSYWVDINISVHSHLGYNKPYIQRLYEDIIPIADSLNPSAGVVDNKTATRFSWEFGNAYLAETPEQLSQKNALFQWREKNSSEIHDINTGSKMYADVPANSLPEGDIEWRVQITSNDSITGDFTEWVKVSTVDESVPNKPTLLSPNNVTVNASKAFVLYWRHNSPISTSQGGFDVDITKDDGESWVRLATETANGLSYYYVLDLTQISNGNIGWRVRTYNSDSTNVSPWSDIAYFVALGQPDPPVIRGIETGKSRPLCQWVSQEQAGYQLQIVRAEQTVYDTGETHGGDTFHKIAEYLQNGQYTVRLRIKNATGLWSEWAEYAASIHAEKRLKITLSGVPVKNGAHLSYEVEVTD